jgi:membrane-bound serine protease (ClpP class)
MRRLLITSVMLATVALCPTRAASAAAQTPAGAPDHVDLIQLDGTLDPIMADFVHDTLKEAARTNADVVIQVNSRRGVLTPARLRQLTGDVAGAPVKVGVWVGPARAGRARGQAVELFRAAPVKGVAPGAKIDGGVPAGVTRAPTLGDFLVDAMGEPSKIIRRSGRPPQRQPATPVLFAKPPLVNRLLHATANPTVPFFLLIAGMLLLLFEFFTAGIGLAAAAGILAIGLSSYGFGVLPTRPGAIGLLVLGMFGLSVDLQAGAPRAWTVIGAVSMVAGSLGLYAGMSVPLVVVVVVLAGAALFVGAAMPAVMRARFSTPTIGRESMLGEMGVARSPVDPDGTVEVRGAPWRARTNRATPIAAGDPLRVVGIDGLVLEVEPESGGAKDYSH